VLSFRRHLTAFASATPASASTTTMKLHLLAIALFAVSLSAAPMARVVAISGPSSIVVERDGIRSTVELSGITIIDPHNASALLHWSLLSTWVLVENGQVYRSPDGMLINAELVKKGFAQFAEGAAPPPTTPVVYLGELDLGKRPVARAPAKAPARRARVVRRSPVRSRARQSRTGPAPTR
jgi:hypothetical protein